ncbi:MAG: hypothetical protein PHD10_04140 [Bacilli bacterium]|nr:hypothetical protein [Bacilli bacterium]MDD4608300.1 hypothetical protein [Bacilli bacterium]
MRDRKVKYLVIGLIIFAIALTGVYALLAANLRITGTATGVGDFKIEFSSFTVSNPEKATATLDDNNVSLSIDANLSFPGDSVTIDFTIKNTGSLAATVDNLLINENSTEDFTIVINGLNEIEGSTLAVAEATVGSIVVTWNAASNIPDPEPVSFDVTIDYIQATT